VDEIIRLYLEALLRWSSMDIGWVADGVDFEGFMVEDLVR